jgi:hypothetical protein
MLQPRYAAGRDARRQELAFFVASVIRQHYDGYAIGILALEIAVLCEGAT